MPGLVHVYCGEGKGKTTAAAGLALRMAGAGGRVVFVQFLKSHASCEIRMLEGIENIRVCRGCREYGFVKDMDEREKAAACREWTELLKKALELAQDVDMLVLDEAAAACRHKMIPEEEIIGFLRDKPDKLEVVITGREPSAALLERADYITEMKKIKHPYDLGIRARHGIEY